MIERLNAGLPRQGSSFVRKLTLVSAPAGFGKTTLVSEWVQALGRAATPPIAIAWLSLDEGHNDPVRFLAYMIAALRTIEANVGRGALSALQSPGVAGATTPPPAEAVLTSLFNDAVDIPDRIILILDDYQVIASAPVDDALAFLLQRMSETAEAGGHTTRLIEILRLQALAFEYVRRLLAAFPIAEPEQTDPSRFQVPESEVVEPLSERELKVLQFIAEGLTNREIASRLYLSLNTVKGHTRNIYGKLHVHSRTQAVARVQGLGLLPRG